MNENHMHDKDRLEKVETVVDHQQASGDSLIDTLASTIPQARADFADELEARLLAVRESQEDHMQQVYQDMDRQPRHRTYRLPVTLAAVLALVLITVALLSGRQPQQAMWMAQIASQTPTLIPTPTSPATTVPLTHTVGDGETLFGIANTYHVRVEDLLSANNLTDASSVIEVGQTLIIPARTPSQSDEVNPVLENDNLQTVVTAKNDIRRGTLLTPDLFTLTYWEETQAGLVDNLDAIDGQYAMVDIPALTPLRTEDMLDRDPIGTLPRNLSYPLNIPISSEAAAQLHPGDRVQIMGELFYPYPDQTYHALTLNLVDLAEVLEVQNTGEQPQVVITIASNKDRLTIQEMIANGATLLLITETRAFSVANEVPPAAEVVTFGDAQAVIRTTTEDCRGSLMGRDLLSVWADPHQDAERVAQVVTQGQTVRVLGEITDPETGLLWYLIRTSTRDGWVTSNHVRLGETCPGLTRTDGELPAPLVLAQDDPRLAETASLPGEGWHMTLNTNSRMVEVIVPMEELPADLPVGDNVGVGTEMQFREAANQTRIEAVAPEPISSYRQYQMLAQATLVRIDANNLVLSMHDDEAADVSWALDAGLPLTLAFSDSSAASVSSVDATPQAVQSTGTEAVPFMAYYEPVIVALTDIAEGDLLNGDQITAAPVFWPRDRRPEGALETLPPQARAARPLQAGEVLLAADVNGEPAPAAQPGIIPQGWVGVTIVPSLIQTPDIQPGDVGSLFTEIVSDQGQVIKRMVIADAVIVSWHNTQSDSRSDAYMIAVTPRDAILLNWLMEAEIPLLFQPTQ